MTESDEIVIVMDNLSTKKTNIATSVTSSASVNWHSKKLEIYFAYSFISDHNNINNYYLLSLCKTKRYNIKWKTCDF